MIAAQQKSPGKIMLAALLLHSWCTIRRKWLRCFIFSTQHSTKRNKAIPWTLDPTVVDVAPCSHYFDNFEPRFSFQLWHSLQGGSEYLFGSKQMQASKCKQMTLSLPETLIQFFGSLSKARSQSEEFATQMLMLGFEIDTCYQLSYTWLQWSHTLTFEFLVVSTEKANIFTLPPIMC